MCAWIYEYVYIAACRRRSISCVYSFQFKNPTHLREVWRRQQAGFCPHIKSKMAAAMPHGWATSAANSEHALYPFAGSYYPSCTGCWGWVSLHQAESWWRCTDGDKEVPPQSQPLNYNKSFVFPWHPSRKVEGTENEVAELLTKIMYAFKW